MAPTEEEYRWTISSDIHEGRALQERILALLERWNYSPREIFAVRLGVEEALANAIKHGNRSDPAKSVHIQCNINRRGIRIAIEDEGEGFRPEEIPDPTAEENLTRPCGRGIMLMRSFLSHVEYNEAGNRIVLEKQREAPDSGRPSVASDP